MKYTPQQAVRAAGWILMTMSQRAGRLLDYEMIGQSLDLATLRIVYVVEDGTRFHVDVDVGALVPLCDTPCGRMH